MIQTLFQIIYAAIQDYCPPNPAASVKNSEAVGTVSRFLGAYVHLQCNPGFVSEKAELLAKCQVGNPRSGNWVGNGNCNKQGMYCKK